MSGYLICPKCGGVMMAYTSRFSHNLTVKTGIFSIKHPILYVCSRCGYMEFYLRQ